MSVSFSLKRLSCLAAAVFFSGSIASAVEPSTSSTASEELVPESPINVNSPESSWAPASSIVDRLPEFLADRLPDFHQSGAIRVYIRPHLGDVFHPSRARIPVGAHIKVTNRLEFNTELGYSSRGRNDTGPVIYEMNLGVKYDNLLPSFAYGQVSVGVNYRTPFNRSPLGYTDGYRHVQPFIALTRRVGPPSWKLLGYGTFGNNYLEHTSLPSNFGKNQLHANSMAVTGGVAREWGRFQASITARVASTELMSDEGRQNFILRPEIVLPLRLNPRARTQLLLALGGRAIWGPDGRSTETTSSLRLRFNLDRHRSSDKTGS